MVAIVDPNDRLSVFTFHSVDGHMLCPTDLHVGIGSSVLGITLVHVQWLGCAADQRMSIVASVSAGLS